MVTHIQLQNTVLEEGKAAYNVATKSKLLIENPSPQPFS